MSYDKTIKYAGLEISFDYIYNGEYLELDSWAAFIPGTNTEVPIPDADFSEEIEDQINKWLDNELDMPKYDYHSEYVSAKLEASFDYWRES